MISKPIYEDLESSSVDESNVDRNLVIPLPLQPPLLVVHESKESKQDIIRLSDVTLTWELHRFASNLTLTPLSIQLV